MDIKTFYTDAFALCFYGAEDVPTTGGIWASSEQV